MEFLKRLFNKDGGGKEQGLQVNLPFTFVVTNGTKALAKLGELRKREDVIPILMGGQGDIDLLIDNLEMSEDTVENIIESSKSIGFPNWFTERALSDEEFYEVPHGVWPKEVSQSMSLSVHLDVISRKPKKQVIIGLIPVEKHWHVPAYLRLGGWNECPMPNEHVAMFKRWEDKYSAKVTCVTSDVIEFTVDYPPTTKEEAMQLAQEQFVYCADIVFQGVETIENLASSLLNSKVWYFWWD